MVSNAVVEGVSGAVGGIAALLTTYPLMTVRPVPHLTSHAVVMLRLAKCSFSLCLPSPLAEIRAGLHVRELLISTFEAVQQLLPLVRLNRFRVPTVLC